MKKMITDNDMEINKIKQGEVYMFRISSKETEGTEIQKNRSVVIVSTNHLNKWSRQIIIVPIISK